VRKLLEVLHRLADLGNSVIIIEHNLDVIRNGDWIIDLGPEGGEDGGRLVGQGRPAKIAATPGSYTGQFLTRYYASTNGQLTPIDPNEEPLPTLTGAESDSSTDKTAKPDPAQSLRAPSFPLLSAERVGNHEPGSSKNLGAPPTHSSLASETRDSAPPPISSKPKRSRRLTPAEEDLASTRAKANRPAPDKPQNSGSRKKKTGQA